MAQKGVQVETNARNENLTKTKNQFTEIEICWMEKSTTNALVFVAIAARLHRINIKMHL